MAPFEIFASNVSWPSIKYGEGKDTEPEQLYSNGSHLIQGPWHEFPASVPESSEPLYTTNERPALPRSRRPALAIALQPCNHVNAIAIFSKIPLPILLSGRSCSPLQLQIPWNCAPRGPHRIINRIWTPFP